MKYSLKDLYESTKEYNLNFKFLVANSKNRLHSFFLKRENELHNKQKEIRRYLKKHGITYPSGNSVFNETY